MNGAPKFALAAAAAIITSASQQSPQTVFDQVAIVGVHLIDAGRSAVVRDQTVLVKADQIQWIGPVSEARVPKEARIIDGAGLFLAPGLVDMHVHVSETDLQLFVPNGVTTIREMNGSARHLVWRDRVAREAGTTWPTLIVAGTLLAGSQQGYRHLIVNGPAAAAAVVRQQAYDGYDFIKVYDGLSPDTFDAILEQARRRSIPVVGHIPDAVGLDRVLASGQKAIEHANGIMQRVTTQLPDKAAIAPTVAKIRQSQIWIEPTQAVIEVLMSRGTPVIETLLTRPEMAYVDSSTRQWWASLRKLSDDPIAEQLAWTRQFVRELVEAGVPILVGTDTPNPFMVPGFSIHDELDALVRAGMSRDAVLRAATAGAAEFMGQGDKFGTIKVGARADLVLLDGNPLVDLSFLRRPRAVVLRGKWHDGTALRRMLEAARRTTHE